MNSDTYQNTPFQGPEQAAEKGGKCWDQISFWKEKQSILLKKTFMTEKVKNIMSVTSNCRFNMVWTSPNHIELNQNFLNGSQKATWSIEMSFFYSNPKPESFKSAPQNWTGLKPFRTSYINIILEESKIILYKKYISHLSEKWYFVTKIVLTYCEKKLF